MDQLSVDKTLNALNTQAGELIVTYGARLAGALAILILGWMVAKWVKNTSYKMLGRIDGCDETLRRFLSGIVRYIILIFTFLAVLSQFGVQTASLIAVIGAAGLAIGLALQGTLSNVAAGVMLLMLRPFKIGDYVEAGGVAGTVENIGLFNTEMATPDNVQIFAPNKQIWESDIKNYSYNSQRRIEIMLGIDYNDDIDKAIKAINDEISKEARLLKEPEPQVAVHSLADSSVNIVVRAWATTSDFWPTKFAFTQALKTRMDKENITIPFPQRTVHHLYAEEAPKKAKSGSKKKPA